MVWVFAVAILIIMGIAIEMKFDLHSEPVSHLEAQAQSN
jgi:hypothetical protein